MKTLEEKISAAKAVWNHNGKYNPNCDFCRERAKRDRARAMKSYLKKKAAAIAAMAALLMLSAGCATTGAGYCGQDGQPYDLVGEAISGKTVIRKWQCWNGMPYTWGGGPHTKWTTNTFKGAMPKPAKQYPRR